MIVAALALTFVVLHIAGVATKSRHLVRANLVLASLLLGLTAHDVVRGSAVPWVTALQAVAFFLLTIDYYVRVRKIGVDT